MRYLRLAAIVVVCGLGAATTARAQIFELIDSFAADVSLPQGPLTLGPDGHLYGTSGIDWRNGEPAPRNWGAVYRIDGRSSRSVLYQFPGTGPGGCGTARVSFGADGAIYGVAFGCDAEASPGAIYRIAGTSFQILQQFPAGDFTPLTLTAGPDGAFYGFGYSYSSGGVALFKWDGALHVMEEYPGIWGGPDFARASDGTLYFPSSVRAGSPTGAIFRITSRGVEVIQTIVGWGFMDDLIMGTDGNLYGTVNEVPFGQRRLYRMTPSGTITYFPEQTASPLAVWSDGSPILDVGPGFPVDGVSWWIPGINLVWIPADAPADGSGSWTRLTRGPDGHFYGVRPQGGANGLGVFFRIRMPRVKVIANGAGEPVVVGPGEPLRIAMELVDVHAEGLGGGTGGEVYLAVVTPALNVFWMTADGFTATPTPLYAGQLPSFGLTTLLTIPDVTALPAGDYYWVAIADPIVNFTPDASFVDFVKTSVHRVPVNDAAAHVRQRVLHDKR